MYLYDTSFTPPAPALAALVGSAQSSTATRPVTVQLDNGADVSDVLNNLRLTLDGPSLTFGFRV